ncbi:MAG: hypothetical protein OEW12_08230 [Deltaproteobacteria bacterium]|nr:hypothetical protein [Deltaproteobacteria bacterium]
MAADKTLEGSKQSLHLSLLWKQKIPEAPVCAAKGCHSTALEVDLFYPYLDDNNRCQRHLQGYHSHFSDGLPLNEAGAGFLADA